MICIILCMPFGFIRAIYNFINSNACSTCTLFLCIARICERDKRQAQGDVAVALCIPKRLPEKICCGCMCINSYWRSNTPAAAFLIHVVGALLPICTTTAGKSGPVKVGRRPSAVSGERRCVQRQRPDVHPLDHRRDS